MFLSFSASALSSAVHSPMRFARLLHVIPLSTHKSRILAQALRAALHAVAHALSPGQALAVAVLGFAGVAAFGITPDTALDPAAVRKVSRALPVPAFVLDTEPGAAAALLALERSLSDRLPFRDLATQLHVLAVRR